jgi:type II secretory pathway component PulF
MPTYTYSAIDSGGMRLSGEIEASDPDAVVSQLTAQGLRIEQVQISAPGRESSLGGQRISRLKNADARELGGLIAEIVSSGMPMEGGLAAIAEEMPHGRLRRSLKGIVRELETGADLESVLVRRRAPPFLAALVRAGRRSGRTAEILESFIANSRVASELRQMVWMALVYPLALVLIIVPLIMFLLLWIVPAFAAIFHDFALRLPWFTEVLFAVSRFSSGATAQTMFLLLGVLLVALVVAGLLGSKFAGTRRLLCGVPVMGPLLRGLALARFSQMLSLLIESGVPLDEALVLAGDSAGDAELGADCRTAAVGVRAGHTLESAVRETRSLPASFLRALSWERHHKAFAEVLESTAEIYAGRARTLLALLVAILPPLIVILVGLFVASVVLALYMPLIELLHRLSL